MSTFEQGIGTGATIHDLQIRLKEEEKKRRKLEEENAELYRLLRQIGQISPLNIPAIKQYLRTPDSRSIYGLQQITGKQRFCQLILQGNPGNQLMVNALQDQEPPDDALKLSLCSLKQVLDLSQPQVFMTLSIDGKAFTTLHIALTCTPRRTEQMLGLCSAAGGHTWQGASLDTIYSKGEPGERVGCWSYITEDGERSSKGLVRHQENTGCNKPPSRGMVYGYRGDYAGFFICTRGDIAVYSWPPLGEVLSGMDELCAAVDLHDVSQITISKTGLIC
ncbi:unnamed protein product [Meganyctiphanes norvegica]|uniref:Uncharacterized protein n=1 Tax=Meganyctiphanes norvegica TaxID=48144 RepID=A0AAV2QD38_MEGNR